VRFFYVITAPVAQAVAAGIGATVRAFDRVALRHAEPKTMLGVSIWDLAWDPPSKQPLVDRRDWGIAALRVIERDPFWAMRVARHLPRIAIKKLTARRLSFDPRHPILFLDAAFVDRTKSETVAANIIHVATLLRIRERLSDWHRYTPERIARAAIRADARFLRRAAILGSRSEADVAAELDLGTRNPDVTATAALRDMRENISDVWGALWS
jgi:hypothetical protein